MRLVPTLSKTNLGTGFLTLLIAGSVLFLARSEAKLWPWTGNRAKRGHEIILEVINRHFTVGKKIPSVYLRVFSDRTAECQTEKFWDEPEVTKTKTLDTTEFEQLKTILDDPELLNIKRSYGLMYPVIDSWMEWDIEVPHGWHEEKIVVLNFSPASALKRNQPYPDALVRLGCSILKIRNDVFGDVQTRTEDECRNTPSIP